MTEKNKKENTVKDGPLLDFKKKLSNNYNNFQSKRPAFIQKPMKKVTGRGR